MCGIWAVFGSDTDVSQLCTAAFKIKHRGPDAFRIESISQFRNSCLGFFRLAIVDETCGMQPARLAKYPNIWLIYNGEIYNYRQLSEEYHYQQSTHWDGEAIIHMYIQHGVDFPAHLDGVFSFCLLDTDRRKVFIGRDTFGVRPCFKLYTDTGFLAVCSEAKGLLGLCKGAGIQHVHPGTVEEYDLDLSGLANFNQRKQFQHIGDLPLYKTAVDVAVLGNDIHQNIRVLLEAAVKKRMMGDRRIGCMLSGGIDSSLVASLLVKNAKDQNLHYPIQTFSIGMEGSLDLIAARKVAKQLGTEHHEVVFSPKEAIDVIREVVKQNETYDVINIRPSVAMYLLSKYISEKTNTAVVLSGEGSDELAQGYIYFNNAPNPRAADEDSRRLLRDIYFHDVLRADRTTTAWGLEVRVPFLDHQLTSYYLSLPPEVRTAKNGVEKHLLRSAFDQTNLLPREILWRPKEGFSDGVGSLERPLYHLIWEFCDDQVTNEDLKRASTLYPLNTPQTKESLFYRRIFEMYYPGMSYLVPYFWMPKWVDDVNDPSARALKHYDAKVQQWCD